MEKKLMNIKINRNEVVAIYNYFKKLNLKGVSKQLLQIIIHNQLLLRKDAFDIIAENEEIVSRFQTEEFNTLLNSFLTARAKYEQAKNNVDTLKIQKAEEEINAAFYKFKPIDIQITEQINSAKKSLENKVYVYTLETIKTKDIIEHYINLCNDFTFEEIEPIFKILED